LSDYLVIGLPKQIRGLLESKFSAMGACLGSILTDTGKEGRYRIVPDPNSAVIKIQDYYETVKADIDNSLIVVLPYAQLPNEVKEELDVIESFGTEVLYAVAGEDGWPPVPNGRAGKLNENSLNQIVTRIIDEIFDSEKPHSSFFTEASDKNANIIIIKDALTLCNDLPSFRSKFLKDAADSFVEYVEKNGRVGDLKGFFAKRGIEHAQTGGINTTLNVMHNNQCIHSSQRSTHLKRGDKTTPEAASRIYYQEFSFESSFYIAVIYVGPHPSKDIVCTHYLN
jgi:hypothetical protein